MLFSSGSLLLGRLCRFSGAVAVTDILRPSSVDTVYVAIRLISTQTSSRPRCTPSFLGLKHVLCR